MPGAPHGDDIRDPHELRVGNPQLGRQLPCPGGISLPGPDGLALARQVRLSPDLDRRQALKDEVALRTEALRDALTAEATVRALAMTALVPARSAREDVRPRGRDGIAAAEAGKDVLSEKPMTRCVV